MSAAQFEALGTVALTSTDAVTLVDTGSALVGLTAAQIAALGVAGTAKIDATDNVLKPTVAQFNALGTVALASRDNDALTLTGVAGNDSFTFSRQTVSVADHIDGGAGSDTLTMRAKLILVISLAIGLACSYGLARAGEPQSHWLWCVIGRAC